VWPTAEVDVKHDFLPGNYSDCRNQEKVMTEVFFMVAPLVLVVF